MEKLLTMQEAAAVLGFSDKNGYKTVQRSIKSGKLPWVKLGRNIRLKESALTAFIERHAEEPGM